MQKLGYLLRRSLSGDWVLLGARASSHLRGEWR